MGQPARRRRRAPAAECIGRPGGTGGTETSQYPEEQESSERPAVAASDPGRAQTGPPPTGRRRGCRARPGLVPRGRRGHQPNALGRAAGAGESPVGDGPPAAWVGYLSTAGHGESRGKLGGPPSKANYPWRPIAHEYREGKVKSTPGGG